MRQFSLKSHLIGAAAGLLLLLWTASATAQSNLFEKEIADEQTFERLSKVVNAERFTKFIIEVDTGEIYYFNVNVYDLHRDFVFQALKRKTPSAAEVDEFNKNYEMTKPKFILGYVTHHQKQDAWSFAFWSGDKINADQIARTWARLYRTFFHKPIPFRPDSPEQEEVGKLLASRGYPVITNDTLYKGSDYQPFNNGRAVGTLRVVPLGTPYDQLIFDRYSIVILQEAYPDISPVAGILSTRFSTPLAHVNLRARAWGIPNAGFINASKDYEPLDGKVVIFETRDQDHTLRAATEAEIKEFEQKVVAARTIDIPAADQKTTTLKDLSDIRKTDARIYGAKTSNLGEIAHAKIANVNVPDGFGIPFAFYADHLKRNKLDVRIDAMLSDWRWNSDPDWKKAELDKLRIAIRDAPMDKKLLDAVWKKIGKDLGGKGVFVRSSTNAEDLDGFNGAGLYETVANVTDRDKLSEAIRTVWSSVWNYKAVEERALYGIDHKATQMGVMIQIGVSATAAGVLVTRNLFNPQDSTSYTINAKWGLGMRVVGGTRIPEQVIFDTKNDGTRIITRSDDPVMLVFDEKSGGLTEVDLGGAEAQPILTEPRAKALSDAVTAFLPLFKDWNRPADVEWVIEGDTVWIVQARPFVE